MRQFFIFAMFLFLSGCSDRFQKAPVEESKWFRHNHHGANYQVQKGDTLYAIAFHHDMDYRKIAEWNHILPPYKVKTGQILSLRGIRRSNVPVHTVKPAQRTPSLFNRQGKWRWPAKGHVVANFFPAQGKKGIDIAGRKGNKIYASAAGVVAYAGSGLSGYGNLIIIKHEGQFLTAYGNNEKNRVVEGQKVKAGQVIAEMGIVDRKFWGVHFEIRKAGHPVNPMQYLS